MKEYTHRQLIDQFQQMHRNQGMFVLPNVWNPGSAYVFEKEGFDAVATSSAGVAYALGYPDGEDITFEDLVLCVKLISRRINIPLSVDFERGYAETSRGVKDNAKALLGVGACGFNIEDGKSDGSIDDLTDILTKIKALKQLKEELDLDFVINARTCCYWLKVGGEKERLQTVIDRGNAFLEAGADCVFVPGVLDEETVIRLVQGIKGPLNIVLNPGYKDFQGLEKCGVKRLSVGSAPVRNTYNHLIMLARELKGNKVDQLLAHDFGYSQANAYFNKE